MPLQFAVDIQNILNNESPEPAAVAVGGVGGVSGNRNDNGAPGQAGVVCIGIGAVRTLEC